MKVVINFIFTFLFSISCFSQNLIINGDFENYDTLPDINGQIQRAIPWRHLSIHADYWYNSVWKPWFDTSITAKSGKGFAGIANSSIGLGCETFGQILSTSLVAGKYYKIGAYCKNGNNFFWPDTCSKLSFYGFPLNPSEDTMWYIHPTDLPNYYLLSEVGSTGNNEWELKSNTFIAPVNLAYIAVTLNGDCNQYILLDSIFCIETESQPKDCEYFIPNAFSPNNDAKNDYFKPFIKCNFSEYSLHIYNRWGELVYSSNDISNSWDGKHKSDDCDASTYMYILQFTNQNQKKQIVKGDIILVR